MRFIMQDKRNSATLFLRILRKSVGALAVLLVWLILWELAARKVGKTLLLPDPLTTLHALTAAAIKPAFWLVAGQSLLRILLGFLSGAAAGALLAIITSFSWICRALLSPLLRVVRSTPVASFIILALLWLRTSVLPGFIAGLMTIPIVWANIAEGITKTDRQLLELAKVYGFSVRKTIRLIYWPTLRPWIRSSCLTSLGLAWKSGVAAEVLCQPKHAIGTQLYYAKIYLETDQLFAWTLVVIFMSVILEELMKRLLRKL